MAPQLAQAQRAQALRPFKAAPVTVSLIGINVAVWLAILVTGGNGSTLIDRLALQVTSSCLISDRGYVYATSAQCAAVGGTYFPGVLDGALWQLITSAFTHVDVLHIGFNMLALWFLGPQLERFLGTRRYLALYLMSAFAGSVAVYWLADPRTSALGASGAVFGLMGALLVIAWRRGGDVRQLLMWLGINVVITFTGSGISWQGHLGGLVGGVAVALIMLPGKRLAGTPTWVWLALLALAQVLLIVVRSVMLR